MPLTLIFKQHDLHPIQREGLSETVRNRVLLLLKNLRYLELCKEIIVKGCSAEEIEKKDEGMKDRGEKAFTTRRSLNRKISR